MHRNILLIAFLFGFVLFFFSAAAKAKDRDDAVLLVAAASSLQYTFEGELIPLFEKNNPGIKIEGTFDSSGKLQAQIENGLAADVFMSAAMAQMNALVEKGFVRKKDVVRILENKIVLVVPVTSELMIADFMDILFAKVIAIGDPKSVPAGQYAREIFLRLGIWEKVLAKASLGSNVTEVLTWVAESSADAGVVYATDAKMSPKVAIAADASNCGVPGGVVYPAAVLAKSNNPEAASLFVEFLASDEAVAVFMKYGFTPVLD